MGQISLARFNRLNVSMSWEGGVGCNIHRWISFKLFIYFKYLIGHIFKVKIYNLFNLWFYSKNNFTNFLISPGEGVDIKIKNNNFFTKKSLSLKLHTFQIYLYTKNNSQIMLITYIRNLDFNDFIQQKSTKIDKNSIKNLKNFFLL